METIFIALFKSLPSKALSIEVGLVSLVILLMFYGYNKIAKPLLSSLNMIDNNLIKREEVNDIKRNIDETIERLEDIIEYVKRVDENGKNLERDAEVLKRDLEQVKSILNQFQGHMLYGRRSSDFENQELR